VRFSGAVILLSDALRLAFDDDHRQGAPDAVEPADLPRDGLLDLLHRVGLDHGDDVVDSVNHIDRLYEFKVTERLQQLLLST